MIWSYWYDLQSFTFSYYFMLLALLLKLKERIAKVQLGLLGTRQENGHGIKIFAIFWPQFPNKANELFSLES